MNLIESINEVLKIAGVKQLNEISEKTVQSYMDKRSKQVDKLKSDLEKAQNKVKTSEKQITKYYDRVINSQPEFLDVSKKE